MTELNQLEQMMQGSKLGPEVAAFFDVDGTLLPHPSLEKRFFLSLRAAHKIERVNYLLWLSESLRLLPRGIQQVRFANKMYLRGVRTDHAERPPLVSFFTEAVERVAWHAECGHAIVIVSGTLEPLAHSAASALQHCLAAKSLNIAVEVCATRLEVAAGSWTGRILGDAMFGEAKVRAMRRFGASRQFDLARSFAYGDSALDRWMLEAVGKPVAVNPSSDLARIAARHGWDILRWSETESPKQTSPQSMTYTSAKSSPRSREELDFSAGIRKEIRISSPKPGNCT